MGIMMTPTASDLARFASELGLQVSQLLPSAALLDEGNTIPFLARYRKEATGGLDEVQLRALQERLERWRKLEERREVIREALQAAGVLSPDLLTKLSAVDKLASLEDLYLPYRPKRRTRASIARDLGLAPLAGMMLRPSRQAPDEAARPYVRSEMPTVEDVLALARDIVAEQVVEEPEMRGRARKLSLQESMLTARKGPKAEDPQGKYTQYYAFAEAVRRIAPHRVLACDRGEAEGVLKVEVQLPDERILSWLRERHVPADSRWRPEVEKALTDGYKRLLAPSLERDVRQALTEQAQSHAITVFGRNLKALLLQPPLRGQVVLGIDPGFRSGCKVAVVDPTGLPRGKASVIHPHEPQNRWDEAKQTLRTLIQRHAVTVVAIGNGTASRETEQLVAETLKGTELRYTIVSEAGASVYSASETAREEFPDLDVTERGTISIARRLQDPLAELVKIDPQAIGVGLYQHDLEQKALGAALDGVVEDAVNSVGIDLNTASASLLTHVAGLNPRIARQIVLYRNQQGPFRRRADLLKVKGLGEKTYEQCVGFLRLPEGAEPLDNTGIHPEAYLAVRKLMAFWGQAMPGGVALPKLPDEAEQASLAARLEIGLPTLRDILQQLEKPGRDPRDELAPMQLRQDVLKLEDVKVGMRLMGTVRNVVDFGAFVDIGVKQDGLVHVSELAERFVRNPLEVVSVGEVLEFEVMDVDLKRGRVSLSRKRVLTASTVD